MSGYMFAAGAVSLLGAAAVVVAALVWGQLEVGIPGMATLPTVALRVLLGVWAVTIVWASVVFVGAARSRLAIRRALRKPGPKGLILITPQTVHEMAGVLLREELGLHKFRVQIRPMGGGLALEVLLHLPPGEEVPTLAERLQSLLAHEIAAKTGLEVPEVRMIVVGTARPGRA